MAAKHVEISTTGRIIYREQHHVKLDLAANKLVKSVLYIQMVTPRSASLILVDYFGQKRSHESAQMKLRTSLVAMEIHDPCMDLFWQIM